MGEYTASIGIDSVSPRTPYRGYTPIKLCERHEGDYTF